MFGVLWCTPSADLDGFASWYQSDIIMDATIEARQGWGQLPQDLSKWDGFAAAMSCDLIGETVRARVKTPLPIGKRQGRGKQQSQDWYDILITDCSGHTSTTSWMADADIKLEFGAATAKMLGIHGHTGVPIQVYLKPSKNPRQGWIFNRLQETYDNWHKNE